MNNDILETSSLLCSANAKKFIDNIDSKSIIKTEKSTIDKDLSWCKLFDDAIVFLEIFVKDAKKFNNSKNDKKAFVNQVDVYENIFIYSLILKADEFLNLQLSSVKLNRKDEITKIIDYKGISKSPSESFSIDVKITNSYKQENDSKSEEEYKNKLYSYQRVLFELKKSLFMITMKGAEEVIKPIKKNSLIFTDEKYKDVYELWKYLEKATDDDVFKVITIKKQENDKSAIEKLAVGAFFQYDVTLKERINKEKEGNELEFISMIINDYVSKNDINEKDFKNLLLKEFREAHKKKQREINEISDVLKKKTSFHEESISASMSYLN